MIEPFVGRLRREHLRTAPSVTAVLSIDVLCIPFQFNPQGYQKHLWLTLGRILIIPEGKEEAVPTNICDQHRIGRIGVLSEVSHRCVTTLKD